MKNLRLTDLLHTELRQFPLQSLQFRDGFTPHLLAVEEIPDGDTEELFRYLVGYDDDLTGGTQGYRLIIDIKSNAELELCADSFSILKRNNLRPTVSNCVASPQAASRHR